MRPTLLLPRLLAALTALLVLPAPAALKTPRPPGPTASSFRPQPLSLFVRPYNYLKFREHPPPKGRKLKLEAREFTKGDYPWREPQTYSHKLRMPGLRVKWKQLLFELEQLRSVRPKRGKFEEDAGGGRRERPRDSDMNSTDQAERTGLTRVLRPAQPRISTQTITWPRSVPMGRTQVIQKRYLPSNPVG